VGTVYLFGTWHHFQTRCETFGTPESEFLAFGAELRRVRALFEVDAIAEELAPAHDNGPSQPTIGEKLAAEVGVHHERLDIGKEAREKLGFGYSEGSICAAWRRGELSKMRAMKLIRKLHVARESIWVDALTRLSQQFQSVLFVLGSSHVESMNLRLRSAGLEVRELHGCWGGRWEDAPSCAKVLR
jgi:hypothetical protein